MSTDARLKVDDPVPVSRRRRNARRSAMKAQWRARQARSLVTARRQLSALVGPPESFPTHAAYMAAVNAAVAAKRQAEREAQAA